jgi:peptide deformylase
VDVAALRIVVYPAPVLRTPARPVRASPAVRGVAQRMLELMRRAEGIGLAATQVGLDWMLFVCDVPEKPEDRDGPARSADADPPQATRGPMVLLNPQIVPAAGPAVWMEEGCLSLPGIRVDVPRPEIVTVRYVDLEGQEREARAGGLLARCFQHEYDHLMGTLIIDTMSEESARRVKGLLRNMERRGK